MTLADQADLATSMASTYVGSLRAAVASAAVAIMAESTDQPNHVQRIALAQRTLRDPGSVTDAFAWAVSTNTTLIERWGGGDHEGIWGDVPFVISTVWDALALSFASL